MYEYAIRVLKQEIFRLNDKEPMMWTATEMIKFENQIHELQSAIKILKREGVNNDK